MMMTENTPSENAASRSVVAFRWGMGPRFGISPIRIRQSCQIRYLDFPAIHLYGSSCHPPCRWRHHLSHEIRGFFRFTERAMPTCSGNLLTACSIVSWWAGAHVSKNDRLRPVITVPGTTLLTWIPSLIACSANAVATVMIAAVNRGHCSESRRWMCNRSFTSGIVSARIRIRGIRCVTPRRSRIKWEIDRDG